MESIPMEFLNQITLKGLLLGILAVLQLTIIVQSIQASKIKKRIERLVIKKTNTLNQLKLQAIQKKVNYDEIEDELNDLAKYKQLQQSFIGKNFYSVFSVTYILASTLLSIESVADTSKKKTNTVVSMMLKERASVANKSNILLAGTLIVYLVATAMAIVDFNLLAVLFPSTLFFAFQVDQYLITYRIRKGWYGRNEYEAREIIEYILSHADKNDFNDDGGLKKLMDKPERLEQQVEDVKGWAKA